MVVVTCRGYCKILSYMDIDKLPLIIIFSGDFLQKYKDGGLWTSPFPLLLKFPFSSGFLWALGDIAYRPLPIITSEGAFSFFN